MSATSVGLRLLLGAVLWLYSYLCFFKPDMVAWLSVAPVLERKSPFRGVVLAFHGILAFLGGVILFVATLREAIH